ncbi:hypothetical protein [Pseudomonas sp. LF242]
MLIVRRAGKAIRVLGGSTSLALRGLYIQANNVLLFDDENVAGKCAEVFDAYWTAPATLRKHPLSPQCWEVRDQPGSKVSLCFAPHADGALSLNPIATSIAQASSSVLYSIVFLSQINGKVRDAQDRRGACHRGVAPTRSLPLSRQCRPALRAARLAPGQTAGCGENPWFDACHRPGHVKARDRNCS